MEARPLLLAWRAWMRPTRGYSSVVWLPRELWGVAPTRRCFLRLGLIRTSDGGFAMRRCCAADVRTIRLEVRTASLTAVAYRLFSSGAAWSSSHPRALRVFRDMRPGETGHTPAFLRPFRSVARVDALSAMRTLPPWRTALKAWLFALGEQRTLHIDGSQRVMARGHSSVSYDAIEHRSPLFLGESFIKVAPGVSRLLSRARLRSNGLFA